MSLINVASGTLFGGVALFGAWFGMTQGYSRALVLVFLGADLRRHRLRRLRHCFGLRELARLAWRWNAPLRTLKRP